MQTAVNLEGLQAETLHSSQSTGYLRCLCASAKCFPKGQCCTAATHLQLLVGFGDLLVPLSNLLLLLSHFVHQHLVLALHLDCISFLALHSLLQFILQVPAYKHMISSQFPP